MSKPNYGGAAMYAGAALGGAVAGQVLQRKIKFFDGMIGRILLIVAGIMILSRAKSETFKAVGCGVSIAGATGFVKDIAGNINGFDGFDGIDGLAGIDGDGLNNVIQDENGMMYILNGVGEYVPYFEEAVMGVDGDDYGYAVAGIGSAIDEAIAGS